MASTKWRRIDPLLVSTAALAAMVRFVGLGSQSLWYDEVVTTQVIGGFTNLLGRIRQKEGTPPLYFVAAAVWSRLFGYGDGAVRSLSAAAGTLTVVVVFAVARTLGQTTRVARIAALLAAVNPFLVWYSQEARAYALFTLLGALSLLFFARSLRDGRTLDFAGFGVVSAMTLLTHYFAVFLIAPEVAVLVGTHWRRWKALLIGVLPLVVAAVPLLSYAADQRSTNHQEWIKAWTLGYRIRAAGRHFLVGPSAPRSWLWAPALAVVLLAIVLLAVAGQRSERRAALAMTVVAFGALALPVVLGAVTSNDYFLDRNVIVALLPCILVVAIGLGVCGTRWARWVGVGAATGGVILSLAIVVSVARDPDLERADWRAVGQVVTSHPGRQVVLMNADRTLDLSLLRYLPSTRELPPDLPVRVRELVLIGHHVPKGRCDWWFGRTCSIAFLDTRLPRALSNEFRLVDRRDVERFTVTRYRASSPVTLERSNLMPGVNPATSLALVTDVPPQG